MPKGLITACCAAAATWAASTGCMVGPDYRRPSAPVADQWLDERSGGSATTRPTTNPAAADPAAAARWWEAFGDPVLPRLVEAALRQNLTLRQAGLRVIQARAVRGIAVGEFFPQSQSLTGSVGENRVSRNTPEGLLGDHDYGSASVGLQAAWELDFWGRFRRGIESADASLDASVADYDAVLVLLVADVANRYVAIRSYQEQLAFTRANVKAQEDTLELTRIRFRGGAVSELDVTTAEATLANTRSLVPQLEDALRQSKLALCVLLGRVPSDLDAELDGQPVIPDPPATVAAGVPADLLRRRPDVRRAERLAAALSPQIGVATADLLPAVSITGQTGFRSTGYESPLLSPSLGNLFDANSFTGFVGLNVNWPILNYGRVENNVRLADARYQGAIEAYRQAVLQAAADVEGGLSTFLRSREQVGHLTQSVTAARRTVDLSLIQYKQGAVDFLRVNQAQVDLVSRQNGLAIARASAAQGVISAYRALGGGWEVRAGHEFVPPETVAEMRGRTDYGPILAPAERPEHRRTEDRRAEK